MPNALRFAISLKNVNYSCKIAIQMHPKNTIFKIALPNGPLMHLGRQYRLFVFWAKCFGRICPPNYTKRIRFQFVLSWKKYKFSLYGFTNLHKLYVVLKCYESFLWYLKITN